MPEEVVIIDDDVDELPAVRGAGMLLAGQDTAAKLNHAMEIAKALSDVIEQQKLFATIGGKKHVLVEGWELLGSLLGVFPVVEWTRPIENGWEARVVAKTLEGAEVGSAEMMCTRAESRWKTADDYAVRSMAQTRAVSKSLRAPLGFVMKLAGYEPTPEPEIPSAPVEQRAFDPERDLVAGAIQGEGAPARINEALQGLDSTVEWRDVIVTATGKERKEMSAEEQQDFWRRLSNATARMTEWCPPGSVPPISEQQIREAFAWAFSGAEVTVTYGPREKKGADA